MNGLPYVSLRSTLAVLHAEHVRSRMAYNTCPQCSADRERRFVDRTPFRYAHVHEYLEFVRPRLIAIRTGTEGGNTGRKYCDSYLERLGQFRKDTDVTYLRQFARRGASAL